MATKRETGDQPDTLNTRLDDETVDLDEHAVATSSTVKGYEVEMNDDGELDPLDELLDAYQAFIRTGMVDFANEVMAVVHDLQTVMVGKGRDISKGHTMGYSNPVGCLSQAYLALVMFPQTRELARTVLDIMDRAAQTIVPSEGAQDENSRDVAETNGMGDYSMGTDGTDNASRVVREIRVEGNQFCVYSTTGRSFGCYAERDAAETRLAQIESFSEAVVRSTSLPELIAMHDAAHNVAVVTRAIKDAHDIISDEIEVVHKLAEPYALPNTVKQAMMTRLERGFVSKAVEYRYTLGPAYVPDREDAHGEFTDTETLQRAMWDWVRKGDRTIYLQHSDKAAGEMVEMMTMPFPLEAELTVPNQGVTKYTFPADTPFLGVVWEEWAWDLVKSGQLRGYSIGGTAKRVEADLPQEALI